MVRTAEIRLISENGEETVVAIPLGILRDLGVKPGDEVFAHRLEHGEIKLSRFSPELQRELDIGRKLMDEYRETFETLAKS